MVVNFSVQIFMVFFGPILVPQLIKLGLSQANAGYGCAICWLSYAIGCPIFAQLYKYFPRNSIIAFSLILSTVSLALCGPSQMLGLPNEIYLIFIGLTLLG